NGLALESRKFAHDPVEPGLTLETDAGAVGERDHAIFDTRIVGKAAEITEYSWIGLSAAEAETGGNGKRHLVAPVREKRHARPVAARQHFQSLGVLADTVGLRRIDLDHIATGTEAAETDQVFHVLRRIEVFSGGKWRFVKARKLCEQRQIKWVTGFLEP